MLSCKRRIRRGEYDMWAPRLDGRATADDVLHALSRDTSTLVAVVAAMVAKGRFGPTEKAFIARLTEKLLC